MVGAVEVQGDSATTLFIFGILLDRAGHIAHPDNNTIPTR